MVHQHYCQLLSGFCSIENGKIYSEIGQFLAKGFVEHFYLLALLYRKCGKIQNIQCNYVYIFANYVP